ncbi:hypothetical protein [Planococcus plakortidis]|uniref:hypothetical protein n=1 Tax=Planococcus plakortidis TaxID=1038856 RepID=UPI00385F574C
MKQMNGQTILLGALVLVLALVSFNLYFGKQDVEQENDRLTEQVEHLSVKEKQSEALYTQTEAFVEATFEGDSLRYFTESYRSEVEAEVTEAETMHGHSRSNTEDLEIFNISVRPAEEGFQVYAIYRITLTGVEGELESPGSQRVMYLMSQIHWIEEQGEWRVEAHDLEPLTSGEEFEEALNNG